MALDTKSRIRDFVTETVRNVYVTDIHTHLFPPSFGSYMIWGIDELLTYHYLIAETFRYHPDLKHDTFWNLSKREQADLVWQTLFIEHSPISEACRGVITVLNRLGLDLSSRDLEQYRSYFASMKAEDYTDQIFSLSKVSSVTMTNDPFDPAEKQKWEDGLSNDSRFLAALRIDPLINHWETAWTKLREQGYDVTEQLTAATIAEVQRFLKDWIGRMNPLYMAVSLPDDFTYPQNNTRNMLIDECIIPVTGEAGIPFAMMIGVKRKVNPLLKDAGDSVGKSDISAVEHLCSKYPDNKFMVTMLSRENQHELAVTARKFRNLLVFGCWWFLNNPSLIEEMTRMRIEMLGVTVIPQHSDCRVLDQLLYKWEHSREVIGKVLSDKYCDLFDAGWRIDPAEIERDVSELFGGTFWKFIGKENCIKTQNARA